MNENVREITKAEAARLHESNCWEVRSFHPTCDSPPSGALVVAAREDAAGPQKVTSRGALRSFVLGHPGPYISRDGRWRTRLIEPEDLVSRAPGWSPKRPWVLERFRPPSVD